MSKFVDEKELIMEAYKNTLSENIWDSIWNDSDDDEYDDEFEDGEDYVGLEAGDIIEVIRDYNFKEKALKMIALDFAKFNWDLIKKGDKFEVIDPLFDKSIKSSNVAHIRPIGNNAVGKDGEDKAIGLDHLKKFVSAKMMKVSKGK